MNGTLIKNLPWQRERIVVVELQGPIISGSRVAEQLRLLNSVAEDHRAKAVVVEVDSPGGSAALSEHLHRALVKIGKKKPVVAHIRSAGLSGGYLVSCAARVIVAVPTAVVGSIGVIIARPVVRELLDKVGVKMFVSRAGKYKDMMQPWREPTQEEEEKIKELRDEYYEWFIEKVSSSRNLPLEKVREYATGEFFTAAKAKAMGLVDELGDLDTAFDIASELGKVPREVTYVRPRRALLERLISPVGAAIVRQAMVEMDSRLAPRVEFRGTPRPPHWS